jgi:hypothetical protein
MDNSKKVKVEVLFPFKQSHRPSQVLVLKPKMVIIVKRKRYGVLFNYFS